jgi:hypothetical protein
LLFWTPLTPLPDPIVEVVVMALCASGAVAAVRLLRLPYWFVLFPPMVDAVLNANANAFIVAMIVFGLGPLAVLAKAYALVPLVGLYRWRSVAIGIGLLLVTVPVLPWPLYLDSFAGSVATLQAQSSGGMSAWSMPWMLVPALVGVAVIGRQAGSWLSVPALWPATQFHYSAIALPVSHPIPIAILAIPEPGAPVAAVAAIVAWSVWVQLASHRISARRPTSSTT